MKQVKHKQASSALQPTPGSRDLPHFIRHTIYMKMGKHLCPALPRIHRPPLETVFPYSLEGLINLGTHTVTNKICFYSESRVDTCALVSMQTSSFWVSLTLIS